MWIGTKLLTRVENLLSLRRCSKPHRYQLRYARLLHSHSIEHRRDAHRFLAVGDENELRLHAHFADQFSEAADVGFVEWSVHFVENAERARLILEDADQQGQRGHSFFAARKQYHILQSLARRRR